MPAPSHRGPVYVECPACGKKSRAKFTDTADSDVIVEYVSTRNHVVGDGLVVLTLRVRPETLKAVRSRRHGSKKAREVLETEFG